MDAVARVRTIIRLRCMGESSESRINPGTATHAPRRPVGENRRDHAA
jgi:hypothetical protein